MKKSEIEKIIRKIRRKHVDFEFVGRLYAQMAVLYLIEDNYIGCGKIFHGYDFESAQERLLYEISSEIVKLGYFPKWADMEMNSHFPLNDRYDSVLFYLSSNSINANNLTEHNLNFIAGIMR